MMTRGGAGTEPEAVVTFPDVVPGSGGGGMLGGVASGVVAVDNPRPGTMPVSGGAPEGEAKVALSGAVFVRGSVSAPGVGTSSGSVFAREPVSEADCLSCEGAGPTRPVGGRVGLFIGWVTAVDQAGGVVGPGAGDAGVGLIRSDPFIGIVAAVPELARDN
jgi:hypothetical protein